MESFNTFTDDSGRTWSAVNEAELFVRSEILPRLPALEGDEVIKESTVRRVSVARNKDHQAIVKTYRIRSWKDQVKFWVMPTRARAEWNAARILRAGGIGVAAPWAFAEKRDGPWLREAYFVCEFLEGMSAFGPWLERRFFLGDQRESEKLECLDPVLRALAQMHRLGLFHRDFHGGNILVREDDPRPRPVVIDLHSLKKVSRVSFSERMKDLSDLVFSLRYVVEESLHDKIAIRFSTLSDDKHIGEERWRKGIKRRVRRRRSIHFRSRGKRCVMESSQFTREFDEGRIHRRRDFSRSSLDESIVLFEENLEKGDPGICSISGRSEVVRVALKNGKSLIVKRYLKDKRLHDRRSRNAWRSSHQLSVRDVPTAEALAVWSRRDGVGYLITEALDRHEALDTFIYRFGRGERSWAEARMLALILANELARLWKTGAFHRDLSAKNILVNPSCSRPIVFVDTDAVKVEKATLEKRISALVQIADLPSFVPNGLKLRFMIRLYAQYFGSIDSTVIRDDLATIDKGLRLRTTRSGTSVREGTASIKSFTFVRGDAES